MTAAKKKPIEAPGRPPIKKVKVSGVLKLSAKTNDMRAFEAGLLYSSRLYNVALDRAAFKCRGFDPPEVPEGCPEPSRPTMPLNSWLRSSLYRSGYDRATRLAGCPLVIVRQAGSFDAADFPTEQLTMWADLWRNRTVVVVPSHGLGLATCKRLCAGSIVDRGVLDPRVTWAQTLLLLPAADGKGAALFGPASLVNAACKDCASAEMIRVGDTYEVKLRRTVEAGEGVTCCYTVGGGKQMRCDGCGGSIDS